MKYFLIVAMVIPMMNSWATEPLNGALTIQYGLTQFYSGNEDQTGTNSGGNYSIEYLGFYKVHFGAEIQSNFDFCPVCDEAGNDYLTTANLLIGYLFKWNYLGADVITGIGIADGEDPTLTKVNEFTTVNFPVKIRPLVYFPLGKTYLSAGLGLNMNLNTRNSSVSYVLPLSIRF